METLTNTRRWREVLCFRQIVDIPKVLLRLRHNGAVCQAERLDCLIEGELLCGLFFPPLFSSFGKDLRFQVSEILGKLQCTGRRGGSVWEVGFHITGGGEDLIEDQTDHL